MVWRAPDFTIHPCALALACQYVCDPKTRSISHSISAPGGRSEHAQSESVPISPSEVPGLGFPCKPSHAELRQIPRNEEPGLGVGFVMEAMASLASAGDLMIKDFLGGLQDLQFTVSCLGLSGIPANHPTNEDIVDIVSRG